MKRILSITMMMIASFAIAACQNNKRPSFKPNSTGDGVQTAAAGELPIKVSGWPDVVTTKSEITLTFEVKDPAIGKEIKKLEEVNFVCKLDEQAEVPCESGVKLPKFTEGVHSFALKVADKKNPKQIGKSLKQFNVSKAEETITETDDKDKKKKDEEDPKKKANANTDLGNGSENKDPIAGAVNVPSPLPSADPGHATETPPETHVVSTETHTPPVDTAHTPPAPAQPEHPAPAPNAAAPETTSEEPAAPAPAPSSGHRASGTVSTNAPAAAPAVTSASVEDKDKKKEETPADDTAKKITSVWVDKKSRNESGWGKYEIKVLVGFGSNSSSTYEGIISTPVDGGKLTGQLTNRGNTGAIAEVICTDGYCSAMKIVLQPTGTLGRVEMNVHLYDINVHEAQGLGEASNNLNYFKKPNSEEWLPVMLRQISVKGGSINSFTISIGDKLHLAGNLTEGRQALRKMTHGTLPVSIEHARIRSSSSDQITVDMELNGDETHWIFVPKMSGAKFRLSNSAEK